MGVEISKEYQDRLDSLPDDEFKELREQLIKSFDDYRLRGAVITDEILRAQLRLIESKSLKEFVKNESVLYRLM